VTTSSPSGDRTDCERAIDADSSSRTTLAASPTPWQNRSRSAFLLAVRPRFETPGSRVLSRWILASL
jgi:hypothetical protein